MTINPLIAAAAAAKKDKERSYSMPPIILEKSASLSALRKYRDEKEDELERSRDESSASDSKSNSFDNTTTTLEGGDTAREAALSPSSLSTSMMAVSERRKSDKKERKEKKEKKEKGSKLPKKEKKPRDSSKGSLLATTDS